MAKRELINMMAQASYNEICERAKRMVDEALPGLSVNQRIHIEAGIAAGVTAAIKAFTEAGLLK